MGLMKCEIERREWVFDLAVRLIEEETRETARILFLQITKSDGFPADLASQIFADAVDDVELSVLDWCVLDR